MALNKPCDTANPLISDRLIPYLPAGPQNVYPSLATCSRALDGSLANRNGYENGVDSTVTCGGSVTDAAKCASPGADDTINTAAILCAVVGCCFVVVVAAFAHYKRNQKLRDVSATIETKPPQATVISVPYQAHQVRKLQEGALVGIISLLAHKDEAVAEQSVTVFRNLSSKPNLDALDHESNRGGGGAMIRLQTLYKTRPQETAAEAASIAVVPMTDEEVAKKKVLISAASNKVRRANSLKFASYHPVQGYRLRRNAGRPPLSPHWKKDHQNYEAARDYRSERAQIRSAMEAAQFEHLCKKKQRSFRAILSVLDRKLAVREKLARLIDQGLAEARERTEQEIEQFVRRTRRTFSTCNIETQIFRILQKVQ